MGKTEGVTVPYGLSAQIEFIGEADGLTAAVAYLAAIERYEMTGEEPEGLSPTAAIVFGLSRGLLDHSRERRESGKRGGKASAESKLTEANGSYRKLNEANGSKEKEEKKEEKRTKREESKEAREVYASSVDNTCSNNSSVLSPSDACAEPEKSDSAPEAPPIASLLLNDGTEFAVTQDIYDRLARTYPAVDTMQQLREIENWCFSNPKNRKTRNGVMRFINSWFSREQDKGLVPKYRQRNQPQPRLTAEEIYNLPAISPWETGG